MDERDLEAIAARERDILDGLSSLNAFIIHAPTDIRALLDEVRRGNKVEELARILLASLSDLYGITSDVPDSQYHIVTNAAAVISDAAKLLGE
ncbi:hypothetical protein JCM15519_17300 [Fundidesulfovibrio butyratiphilus]